MYHLVPKAEYAKECFSTMNVSNMQISFLPPISGSTLKVVFIDIGLFQIRTVSKDGIAVSAVEEDVIDKTIFSEKQQLFKLLVTILTHASFMFKDIRKRFKNT